VLAWPEDGKVLIKSLAAPSNANLPTFQGIILDVDVLGCNEKPVWQQNGEGLHVSCPGMQSDMPVVIRVTVD